MGGNDGEKEIDNVEYFSFAEEGWKNLNSIPTARQKILLSTNGKYIYAMSGIASEVEMKVCERYDILHDTWENIPNVKGRTVGVVAKKL
jgi:hypothetical protein